MGAVLSAQLKANSIQNRPLAREIDGSWLSMNVQFKGLLEGSLPFPSMAGESREANFLLAQGRLNYPTCLDHEIGACGRKRHPIMCLFL